LKVSTRPGVIVRNVSSRILAIIIIISGGGGGGGSSSSSSRIHQASRCLHRRRTAQRARIFRRVCCEKCRSRSRLLPIIGSEKMMHENWVAVVERGSEGPHSASSSFSSQPKARHQSFFFGFFRILQHSRALFLCVWLPLVPPFPPPAKSKQSTNCSRKSDLPQNVFGDGLLAKP